MEFWGTVVLHIMTLFVLSGAFPDTHWSMKLAAMVISGLGQLGFTHSRTLVKTNSPSTVALLNGGAELLEPEEDSDMTPPPRN